MTCPYGDAASTTCHQRFQRGIVYSTPGVGTHAVKTAYMSAWKDAGWQAGLGYPTGPESCGLYGGGCYQPFQKANVYYTPATGAHAVFASYMEAWKEAGWQAGLGYPTARPAAASPAAAAPSPSRKPPSTTPPPPARTR